ncbi:Crp/Fnr family transcriptional regulator [Allostreptomyces psammosilenae]|uniref:CRP-like cAMP-binding protein n=1 Tax=Allostreptomyces psammosilenae TaxID=1892865 RepID=A0A852ZX75_9ACTN|nr:Crp/Fnr family transcriptional regulator [Allostreptomyces psammosilenae]NYI05850.1 CRP-like cAMP-binding protein [Allostreptomyces psammosilenae]
MTAPRVETGLDDRVPYLARLGQAERDELLALGRRLTYRPREVVLRQGEPSTHVLIVLRGWTKVTASAPNGYEALLALRGPGDVVGESAALDDAPRSATVAALAEVEAVVIRREDFTAFLERTPSAMLRLLSLMADRLRAGDRRRVQFAALTVRQRLAGLLLELAQTHGEHTDEGIAITVGLSQQELAGHVGASREAITRELGDFRDRGWMATRRRRLVVLRPDLLRRAAASAG